MGVLLAVSPIVAQRRDSRFVLSPHARIFSSACHWLLSSRPRAWATL